MKNPLIQSSAQLQEFCSQLEPDFGISIDTEFMRQKTYYAIPALVQIAQEQDGSMLTACIDAPRISDWSSLQSSLESSVYCLAHSPDQDFEIFDQLFDDWNFTIYDTQIAAALLGEQTQISYAQMIQLTLDLEIDKSQSRTDWLKRPLSQAQLDYALADVIHLPEAWRLLEGKLSNKERLDWFYADSSRQVKKHQKSRDAKTAWRSVKGIRNFKGNEFAIAASLAQWREQEAKKADLPRRWMIADDAILELTSNPNLFNKISERWNILRKHQDHVQQLLNNPLQEFLNIDTHTFDPLSAEEKKRYQTLKQYCIAEAKTLGLDPAVIANRKTLEKIIRGSTEFLDENNWRHRMLLNYLNGND